MRKIRWPLTPVFTGDVVALKSPLASLSDTGSSIMIRRIAAMEGDELELAGSLSSADQEDEVVEVPKGHCWVLADNHELNHHQVCNLARTLHSWHPARQCEHCISGGPRTQDRRVKPLAVNRHAHLALARASQVADSRAFGPLPLENVVGRVLYHGTCPEDAKPVVNSPLAFDADDDIIEAEIDPEKVFSDQSDTHEQ